MQFEKIRFENHQASKVQISTMDHIPQALKTLSLAEEQPVIVVVGGAGGIREEDWEPIRQTLEVIAMAACDIGAAIVDGGTDSGVMALNGQIRTQKGYAYPLIGVAAVGTVKWPGRQLSPEEQTQLNEYAGPLDPHHTHFILTPGNEWGDESPWLAEIASQLAGDQPSVAVLINGGQISKDQDVPNNMKAGRTVLVIEGTGRAADEFATHRPNTKLMRFIHIGEPERLAKEIQDQLQPAA
jgi:hypothetical protein